MIAIASQLATYYFITEVGNFLCLILNKVCSNELNCNVRESEMGLLQTAARRKPIINKFILQIKLKTLGMVR